MYMYMVHVHGTCRPTMYMDVAWCYSGLATGPMVIGQQVAGLTPNCCTCGCNPGQVVHACAFVTEQYILVEA